MRIYQPINDAILKLKKHNKKNELSDNVLNIGQKQKIKKYFSKLGNKLILLGSKIFNACSKSTSNENEPFSPQEQKELMTNFKEINQELIKIKDNINKNFKKIEEYSLTNELAKNSVKGIPINMKDFLINITVESAGYHEIRSSIKQCKTPVDFKKILAKILLSKKQNKINQQQKTLLKDMLAKQFSIAVSDIDFVKKIDNVFVRHMLFARSLRNNLILENYAKSESEISNKLPDAKS